MQALLISFVRAVRSLFVPGMFFVFVWSVIATVAVLVAFVVLCGFGSSTLASHEHLLGGPWGLLGSVGGFVIAWLLFPGIMPVIVNFFDVKITSLIEKHEYPAAGPVREQPFAVELLHDAKFSALTILLNIIILPLYLIPLAGWILFFGINGYLLGREFFVMAAKRHMSLEEAEALRKKHGRAVNWAGVALAVLATVPVVNLFAPFWGIAVMIHLFHYVQQTPRLLPPEKSA